MAIANPSITPIAIKMAPSTLDLFVLTFNCAKRLINAAVFASHLQAAFKQNATALPEVVVFSLQEVSPLASAFIGGSFISPYLLAFEEALNLAAAAAQDANTNGRDETVTVAPTASAGPVRPYTLVRARNVGMTAIMLFARDPAALRDIQEAEVGFGANNMGNKGAVALRATFGRTKIGGSIMEGLAFEDPKAVVRESPALTAAAGEEAAADNERSRLLAAEEDDAQSKAQQARLQDLSVFRPSAHLFVAGDLNYRISAESPPPKAPFPSLDDASEHHYPRFFETDQLTAEREAGRTLHGMSEAEVRSPPTYKYHVLDGENDKGWGANEGRRLGGAHRRERPTTRCPLLRTSDHRPVFLRVDVPMLSPTQMREALAAAVASAGGTDDPRAKPPVDVDVDTWAARAAARRSEKWAGSTMYLWTTRAGAYAIAGLLGLGIAGYLWVGRSQTSSAA
ncbi:conserved hypothetical protein [Verticillium alfalfae VaMs.102]|uniref:Inositol polyphosphate-related phosphatase domain-containing protein n=1 Tax=Verticillium alfalfae (strain VaMs.102 / ATCC MYA-4576 / FGSC 10136) TaxID=526221 RepID=C9S9K0_VERA1|nr:conserved hypothetical protein [Verticillium alfalfae VaMs.102]EEY16063.1 conserved hypothetical protein [Verticillium alfalfae VaMs.102]